MDKYNPWVRTKEKLGSAQAGTFVFSQVGPDGISAKHIVDDVAVNEPLLPPPGAENAILAGGINIEVQLDTNYQAAVVDGNRLRTVEIVLKTLVSPLTPGSYGKGAVKPSTSPVTGTSPKL
jgi:hypothetical protein